MVSTGLSMLAESIFPSTRLSFISTSNVSLPTAARYLPSLGFLYLDPVVGSARYRLAHPLFWKSNFRVLRGTCRIKTVTSEIPCRENNSTEAEMIWFRIAVFWRSCLDPGPDMTHRHL